MQTDNINKEIFDHAKKNKWGKIINKIRGIDFDVNIKDNMHFHLLDYAIIHNKRNIVKILIEKGARIDYTNNKGRTILHEILKYNYMDLFGYILQIQKKIVGLDLSEIFDNNGNTILHYAIIFKNLKAVQILLKNNVNINIKNKIGYNSLHIAINIKHLKISNLLIDNNIDINVVLNNGESALHLSCNRGLYEISKKLLDMNIDIDIQDKNNEYTALMYCVNLGNPKLTQLLLLNNADVNIQDFYGNTALHYVVHDDNFEIFAILMEKSKMTVNVNILNIESKLPLHIVLENKNKNIHEYFKKILRSTNINYQDIHGNTCLHYIIKYNYWEKYYNILTKMKLDVILKNNKKERPIDYVSKTKFVKFIDMIKQSYKYILYSRSSLWANDIDNICGQIFSYNDSNNDSNNKVLTSQTYDKIIKQLETHDIKIKYNKTSSLIKIHQELAIICDDLIKNKIKTTIKK